MLPFNIETQNSVHLPNLEMHLLGRRITFMTASAIIEAIHTACIEKNRIVVANYNVHSFNLSMQLPWFYEFLQNSEIAHCDGMGILKAMEWIGKELSTEYRASYTILMPALLEHCNHHGLSIFLLGSQPKHLNTALKRLRGQYSNIKFDGHHGYFSKLDPTENDFVIAKINAMNPNILIVGMGMPVQEHWIWQNRNNLNTNVIMPGGAVIDRLAGIIPDCPSFFSNLGLEWLYRLHKEPKRLAIRYLVGNPAFVLQIFLYKLNTLPLKIQLTALNHSGSRINQENTTEKMSVEEVFGSPPHLLNG